MGTTIVSQMIITFSLIGIHFTVAAITYNKDSALLHYSSGFIAAAYVANLALITIRLLVR